VVAIGSLNEFSLSETVARMAQERLLPLGEAMPLLSPSPRRSHKTCPCFILEWDRETKHFWFIR
jgi:hypothetical protein